MGKQFMQAIDFDWDSFRYRPAYWYVVVRTEAFDEAVCAFVRNNPMSVIINLGAGLCTRYYRIGGLSFTWIDIDFSEVFAFRGDLGEAKSQNHLFISGNILDLGWMDALDEFANRPVFFIAEGLMMYFSEKENKRLLSEIARRFPQSQMIFEAISPQLAWAKSLFTGTKFSWGLRRIGEIEEWDSRIVVMNEWPYLDRHPELLSCARRLVNHLPLFKGMGKIIQVKFIPPSLDAPLLAFARKQGG
jgi:O-methyltransferase involved in polyketide biosynthesis